MYAVHYSQNNLQYNVLNSKQYTAVHSLLHEVYMYCSKQNS